MNNICQHGGGEVEAEHVYLGVETFFDEGKYPANHFCSEISSDYAFLDAAFLEDGEAETLGHATVVLLFEDLYCRYAT